MSPRSALVDPPAQFVAPPVGLIAGRPHRTRFQRWFLLLLAGAALWGLAVATLTATRDVYVVPAVVLIGTFLVPVAWLIRIHDLERAVTIPARLLGRAFAVGGLVGFLASALIERPFNSLPAAAFDGMVGTVEEMAKLAVVVVAARYLPRRTAGDGYLLGAAVGFGFAAFESAGYGLSDLIRPGGSYSAMESTVIVRAVMAPVTHGMWTAILGAVLLAESGHRLVRVTPKLIAAFAGVVALHTLWDLIPDATSKALAHVMLTSSAFGPGSVLSSAIGDAGLTVVAFAGLLMAHAARRFSSPATSD